MTYFTLDTTHYKVDLTAEDAGLWRQNAMTTYDFVRPYMIAAREVEIPYKEISYKNKPVLFYHVACEGRGWIQISTELGNEILSLVKKHSEKRVSLKELAVGTIISWLVTGVVVSCWVRRG
jgi:hypothetical protein